MYHAYLSEPAYHWRTATLLLCWCLLLVAPGCSHPDHDALRFGLASAPITLDPRYATDATSARINRLLYRQLVDFDEAARPVPDLADWQRLAPTHYRFRLRDTGRVFHNGSRLEASDVKATYASVLDPKNNSPHRSSLSMVSRIEVVDADTIDFFLDHSDPLFPGYLVIGIVPQESISAGRVFDTKPIGSGPFRFRDWPSEDMLRLERRRDGRSFEFVHVPDATVRVLKLLRGEIDMLQNDLPRELVRYLEDQEEIYIRRRTGSNFTYLGFNLEDSALSQVKVRRAIALAVDREAIVRHVLGGLTRLANGLLPPDHWAGNSGLDGYTHDPQRARRLLAELGYDPSHPLRITYKTSSDPFRVRIATIIQRQLAEVGIAVDLQSYDWATFYSDIKAGRFQVYSLSWVGIKSPDIFRYVFHSASIPPAGANRGRYRSAKADQLIEAAEHANGLEQRARRYRQLQAHLLETLPYVPLWYEEHFFVARRGIEGYVLPADGNYDGLMQVRRVSRPLQEH